MLQHLIRKNEDLRMVPTDHDRLAAAVEELREELRALRTGTDAERQRMLTRWVGIGLVALGRFPDARDFLQQSLALATAAGHTRAVISTVLNLGDAYRYAGDVEAAAEFYRQALDTARTQQPELLDFALQHFAKHLMEQGDLAAARNHLLEARRLRIVKGDTDLIESTRAALHHVELLAAQAQFPGRTVTQSVAGTASAPTASGMPAAAGPAGPRGVHVPHRPVRGPDDPGALQNASRDPPSLVRVRRHPLDHSTRRTQCRTRHRSPPRRDSPTRKFSSASHASS